MTPFASSYRHTLQYLYSLQRVGIKYTLDNIRYFMDKLGHPEKSWPAIHIAGTNGKGSTAAILSAILREAGIKVGLYTSPHLIDFTERIRISGKPIPKQLVIEFTQWAKPWIEQIQPSFFEVTTAMAFWYFQQEKVDLAVIEAGMGGRLDSTNIVHPLISVITRIGLDHQKYLGENLTSIAKEKAGILKSGVPCILYCSSDTVLRIIRHVAKKRQAPLINLFPLTRIQLNQISLDQMRFEIAFSSFSLKNLITNLVGHYQLENLALALGTIWQLQNIMNIPEKAIRHGLRKVVWPGRLEKVHSNPILLIDVSHNPQGFQTTFLSLRKLFPEKKFVVLTALQEDKDILQIGKIVAANADKSIVTSVANGRMANPKYFAQSIHKAGGKAFVETHTEKAFWKMWNFLTPNHVGIVIGSHYLAGAIYRILQLS